MKFGRLRVLRPPWTRAVGRSVREEMVVVLRLGLGLGSFCNGRKRSVRTRIGVGVGELSGETGGEPETQ